MTFWAWLIKYHPETQKKRMDAFVEYSRNWPCNSEQFLRNAVGDDLYQQWRAYTRITQ